MLKLNSTIFLHLLLGCPTANSEPLSRGQPHSHWVNLCVSTNFSPTVTRQPSTREMLTGKYFCIVLLLMIRLKYNHTQFTILFTMIYMHCIKFMPRLRNPTFQCSSLLRLVIIHLREPPESKRTPVKHDWASLCIIVKERITKT